MKKNITWKEMIFALLACILLITAPAALAEGETEHIHDGITFTAWEAADRLPQEPGSYYLTTDVSIVMTWYPPEGITNLCLNGHTITFDYPNGSVIEIKSGSTLNLYDENNTGRITGGQGSSGTGVRINSNAVFNMKGGCITENNNTGNIGGGVYVNGGTFEMSGGTISGNTAIKNGGGVYVIGGTFEMSGGTITVNTANNGGGGVYLSSGTFEMSGGTITANTTDYSGGGVYLSNGTFEISGGTITGNTAGSDRYGGGVCVFGGTFSISGTPMISGNTLSDNTRSDVELYYGEIITIGGTLGEMAFIGVLPNNTPPYVFTSGLSGKGTAANFFSDNGAYSIRLNTDNEAELDNSMSVVYYANGADSGTVPTDDEHYTSENNTVTVLGNTGNLAKDGFTFAGWNTEADGTGTAYAAGDTFTISESTALYARWAGNVSYLIVIPDKVDFGTLSLPDDENTPDYKTVDFTLTADKIEDLSEGFKLVVSVKGEGENNQFFIANDADSSVKLVFEILVDDEVLDVSGANGGKVAAFTAPGKSEARILRLDQVQLLGKPLAQIVGGYSGTMVFYSRLE